MKAYLTLQQGNTNLGTLHLELYDKTVPKTVSNFSALLQRPPGRGYLGCPFHRIIPGFMAQGGDFTNHDGTGGESIYGKTFVDENFCHKHDRAGSLSMANSGVNTNGSQFFVTFRPTPHLDGKHVVFGHVDLTTSSADTLNKLEKVQTGRNDRPRQPVIIIDCGVVHDDDDDDDDKEEPQEKTQDTNEIDLDEEEEEEEEEADKKEEAVVAEEPLEEETPQEEEEEEEDDQEVPCSKSEALKRRLRKLKQKMNQARQLNRQAVKQEGERLSQDGMAKERKRQSAMDKKAKDAAWRARNAKAMETAKEFGVDGKHLTEQAAVSVETARIESEKREANRYSMKDYHNPEGQHRNYQRSLKSLPRQQEANAASTDTYNPLQNEVDPGQEREGARRLASELHRRMEKKRKNEIKRKQQKEDGDVSHINKRNRLFNEKIARNYDKHTAEIRQNLERGTAL